MKTFFTKSAFFFGLYLLFGVLSLLSIIGALVCFQVGNVRGGEICFCLAMIFALVAVVVCDFE